MNLLIEIFKKVIFSLEYPSNSFKDCYNVIKNIKNARLSVAYLVDKKPDNKFQNDKMIHDLSIKSLIVSIVPNMFNGCTSLVEVSIPNSVNSIGDSAFGGCSSLAQISIPNSVSSIEKLGISS